MRQFLWLIAYTYGNDVGRDEYEDLGALLVGNEAHKLFELLVNNHFVIRNKRYYYSDDYCLAPGLLFRVLKDMIDQGKEALIAKIAKRRKWSATPLPEVRIAISLIKDEHPSASILYGSQVINELSYVLIDPDFGNMFESVPDSVMDKLINSKLSEVLFTDADVDWEYLKRIIISDREKKRKSSLTHVVRIDFNFYYYLATGRMCIDVARAQITVNSLLTVAIQLLCKGDYEQSYKLFGKAMMLSNKNSLEKSVFDFFIADYFYAICLLLVGDEKALKKLDVLTRKNSLKRNNAVSILFYVIHNYFILHADLKIDNRFILANLDSSYLCTSFTWLNWMLLSRIGCWPDSVKAPSLTSHQPHAAWLRNELSATGMVPEADEAKTLFGGSLFYRIKVKPVWAMRLEEIINESGDKETGANAGADNREERLIYLIEYSRLIPIQQKRLKSGSWSTGKRLSVNQLRALDASYLDETDNNLIRNLTTWSYDIYIDDYIRFLVGCNHVYTGSQYDLLPVSIHEDKPFLIIDKAKDGSFSVSTNVEKVGSVSSSFIVKKNSDTDYSVYHPSSLEKKVYSQILGQNRYPAEAEPLLLKLISAVGGRMEIHSNMVVELDDLERVDGSTVLTLRCIPDRYDVYNVSVSVHSIGSLAFVPGKGNITTIADKDGQKVQVVRNIKAERKHLKSLCEKLADLDVIDSDTDFNPTSITDTLRIGLEPFLELLDWVRNNPDTAEMEWPEGAKVKYHPSIGAKSATIGFKQQNGWFEVEGDIEIDEGEVLSLKQLLELMHSSGRGRYIKVGECEYITLSTELSRILKRLDTVTTDRRNRLGMSTAAAALIGDVLDDTTATVHHNKALDTLRERIKQSQKEEPQVPDSLQATLRDYQLEGYEWMWRVTSWGAGACLADDMGLGKTLQTIALLLDREADGPSLVVAPASVVPNWRNELARFAPLLNVTILNQAENRIEAVKEAKSGDVVVATYAMLNIEQEHLASKDWNVVCLDEAHTIKNPNTKMSRAAMSLGAHRKVILTGTPIQNHLSELWNLFQFINPGLLGSAEQFSRKYIEPIEGKHNKERQNQLRRLISPFLLRRTKGEVIEELPEKDEITVPVELSQDEMTMYEVRRRQAEDAVMRDKSLKVSTLAEITKLRQMACSCSLVDKKWRRPSSKVLAFIDLAESLNDSGNRALVFSQFTSFFEEVRRAMDKAKLPYLYLDGSTPMSQREKLVRDFQTGRCPFFLISLKAGGLGLNLTGANYVIHLDPWWNPAIEQQATDRAYRIGQKQDVTVYHLISQHTIEEKILRLHKTKRDLADSLLEGTDMSHALTQEELLELLK